MVGKFVMTENELRKKKPTPESVGMGSYTIDSHNVQRYIKPDGFVQNEGDIGVSTNGPYEIAYGSLVPKDGQAENLLVPVAMSASHIAYGSIRMEPVFMILGQSAASAAVMAIDGGLAVQKVPYATLREQLLKDGQVLEFSGPNSARGVDPKSVDGIVVDDRSAKLTGSWTGSTSAGAFLGDGYQHDGDARDGKSAARFEVRLPKAGKYRVFLAAPPNDNRATNAPVEIHHLGGVQSVKLNLRSPKPAKGVHWFELGEFECGTAAAVVVTNQGADGHVVVDGVRWVPVTE